MSNAINETVFTNKLSSRLLERAKAETSFELQECARCGFYNQPKFTPRNNLDEFELMLLAELTALKKVTDRKEVRDFWPSKSKSGFWHYLCEPCAKAKVGR